MEGTKRKPWWLGSQLAGPLSLIAHSPEGCTLNPLGGTDPPNSNVDSPFVTVMFPSKELSAVAAGAMNRSNATRRPKADFICEYILVSPSS